MKKESRKNGLDLGFDDEDENDDKAFSRSEDVIFLIETGNAYFSKGENNLWEPNMGYVLLSTFNELIKQRMNIDIRDRYMLIFYNADGITMPINEPTTDANSLLSYFSEVAPPNSQGKARFLDAISQAGKVHLATFRRVGDKTLRIICITQSGDIDNIEKAVQVGERILKPLEIYLDAIKVDMGIPVEAFNTISKNLGGELRLADDPEKFRKVFLEIGKKKKVLIKKYTREYSYSEEQIMGKEPLINVFLEKVASDLVDPAQKGLTGNEKCQICFKEICVHNDPSHLKVCKNCGKPMHLCCAAEWSSQMKLDNPYVFRCPFCFFLLKVPHEFVNQEKVNKILEKKKREIKEIHDKLEHKAKKESSLKQELLIFQENLEKTRKTDFQIFEDWLDEVLPYMNPNEKMKLLKEFKSYKTADEKNEFINFIRFSKNIEDADYPEF